MPEFLFCCSRIGHSSVTPIHTTSGVLASSQSDFSFLLITLPKVLCRPILFFAPSPPLCYRLFVALTLHVFSHTSSSFHVSRESDGTFLCQCHFLIHQKERMPATSAGFPCTGAEVSSVPCVGRQGWSWAAVFSKQRIPQVSLWGSF